MSVPQDDEPKSGLMKETDELFMFTDQERSLLLHILSLTLRSVAGRELVLRRFGDEYLWMGGRLLVKLGGKESQISFPHRGEMIEPEKDASIKERYKGEDFCTSETHQEQSMQVYEMKKKPGRVKKKRIRWELASGADVRTYRLYWSKNREVNYDSNYVDIGRVSELIVPDDMPFFHLKTGKMELGISAITPAGNESNIARFTLDFNFEVPDTPQSLTVENL